MKTEYKYGLGSDRRELSYFQTKSWLNLISAIPKKFSNRKGMQNPNSRFDDALIEFISWIEIPAAEIKRQIGMSERYVYMIRAEERRKKV